MDRREKKTKKAIREAFLQLLMQKPVGQITVTEISRQADLGRGTFYLHYRDVYDLYDAIENELYVSFVQIYDGAHTGADSVKMPAHVMVFVNPLTEYIDQNRDLILLLNASGNHGRTLFHKLKEFFYEQLLEEFTELQEKTPPDAFPKYTPEFNAAVSMFCVAGVIGVLEEWLNDGRKIPQREIAEMLYQLILRLC